MPFPRTPPQTPQTVLTPLPVSRAVYIHACTHEHTEKHPGSKPTGTTFSRADASPGTPFHAEPSPFVVSLKEEDKMEGMDLRKQKTTISLFPLNSDLVRSLSLDVLLPPALESILVEELETRKSGDLNL